MTPSQAFILASNYGVLIRTGDEGGCLHSFRLNDGRPVSEAHRAQCLEHLQRRLSALDANLNNRPTGQKRRGMETAERELGKLRDYLADAPLYTDLPEPEAGRLALRALQHIAAFAMQQDHRMGETEEIATRADWGALFNEIQSVSESALIGCDLSPAAAPTPRRFEVTLTEVVKYTVTVEAATEDDAGTEACRVWAASQDPIHDFCGQGEGVEVDGADEISR